MSKMSVDDIGNVLSTYIEQSLLPKATGIQRFFTAMASVALADQSKKLAAEYAPLLDMLGISSGGHIDIDKVHSYASSAFAKTGKFEYAGVIFCSDDVDELVRIAERYAE